MKNEYDPDWFKLLLLFVTVVIGCIIFNEVNACEWSDEQEQQFIESINAECKQSWFMCLEEE